MEEDEDDEEFHAKLYHALLLSRFEEVESSPFFFISSLGTLSAMPKS